MPVDQYFQAPVGITPPPLSFATRTGNLLFVSGIPGFDASGALSATFEAQFDNVVLNLHEVLRRAGCTLADVVKVTVILTRPEDVGPMNRLYADAFGPGPYPARTSFVAQQLPDGAMLIEIECIAAIPGPA